jgi:hypothetical protein
MEPAPIRHEVHNFTQACKALAGFAHATTGLTDLERETVRKSVLALEAEVGPFSPEPSQDDPPLAATLSNLPLID